MKTVGIIGGIGPESTIEYYRSIIRLYRKQKTDGSYPSVLINSIDLQKMLSLIEAKHFTLATGYLVDEVKKLARAGADFGVLAAGTPHIIFEDIGSQSPIPLLSIVETTCEEAKAMALKRIGLFGTRFTMQGRFFPPQPHLDRLPQRFSKFFPDAFDAVRHSASLSSIFLPQPTF